MASDLRAEKGELRDRMRSIRDAIPDARRSEMGSEVRRRLMGLPAWRGAGGVLLFYSFGSEVPTAGIVRQALREGRRVFLPRLVSGRMEIAEIDEASILTPTAYGPKEPSSPKAIDPSDVDVVVAPGLAFDRDGYRLGYGRGHYDRFLRRLRPSTPRIGIAFHEQVLPRVPHGRRDQRMDAVVTDSEIITCPARTP
jgi:5-formyltetrahydrofolate cyclo-ligase